MTIMLGCMNDMDGGVGDVEGHFWELEPGRIDE